MARHGITYEQYHSVRENLIRIGLLTTKKEKESMTDLEALFDSVKDINKFLENLTKGKKVQKLKDPKMKSKERPMVSKFGKDFHNFFIDNV